MKKILYILPRLLAILITVFVSLFAMDSFEFPGVWYQKIGVFLIHLIPTYFLLIATIIAWKKPKIGGWIFIVIGILFSALILREPMVLIIIVPQFLIGILFIFQRPIFKKENTK